MTRTTRKKQDSRTRAIYAAVAAAFPEAPAEMDRVVYLYNPYAIRLRVVSDKFKKKSHSQRQRMVMDVLEQLPLETTEDLTMLIAMTPEEQESGRSLVNLEFDDPSLSRL